ncbi:unnamed protein product [Microthlaspi erraticum]|uniref:Uncharacterized protein n=1 Tax=Microthlaspi erraticum TaxID=1685480 RepID=A0A6D2HIF3_9BRAS|nr:unnamed protein product [Microthlaspi erraticum]
MANHLNDPITTSLKPDLTEKEEVDEEMATGTWLSASELVVCLAAKPCNPEAPMLLDRMMRQLTSHSILKCWGKATSFSRRGEY